MLSYIVCYNKQNKQAKVHVFRNKDRVIRKNFTTCKNLNYFLRVTSYMSVILGKNYLFWRNQEPQLINLHSNSTTGVVREDNKGARCAELQETFCIRNCGCLICQYGSVPDPCLSTLSGTLAVTLLLRVSSADQQHRFHVDLHDWKFK